METQLFAKLKDGRVLPVKNVDGQAVSVRIRPGIILTVPMTMVKRLMCFRGRQTKE